MTKSEFGGQVACSFCLEIGSHSPNCVLFDEYSTKKVMVEVLMILTNTRSQALNLCSSTDGYARKRAISVLNGLDAAIDRIEHPNAVLTFVIRDEKSKKEVERIEKLKGKKRRR